MGVFVHYCKYILLVTRQWSLECLNIDILSHSIGFVALIRVPFDGI